MVGRNHSSVVRPGTAFRWTRKAGIYSACSTSTECNCSSTGRSTARYNRSLTAPLGYMKVNFHCRASTFITSAPGGGVSRSTNPRSPSTKNTTTTTSGTPVQNSSSGMLEAGPGLHAAPLRRR